MSNAAGQFWDEVDRLLAALRLQPRGAWPDRFPRMNLFDADDRYILTAEVPGHDPTGIELTMMGDTLTISGEQRARPSADPEKYRRRERAGGRWSRAVAFPGRVDGHRAQARVVRGILTVEIPKSAAPLAVEIRVAGGSR